MSGKHNTTRTVTMIMCVIVSPFLFVTNNGRNRKRKNRLKKYELYYIQRIVILVNHKRFGLFGAGGNGSYFLRQCLRSVLSLQPACRMVR